MSSYQILFPFPSLNLSTQPDLSPWATPNSRSPFPITMSLSLTSIQILLPLTSLYHSPRLTPWVTPKTRSLLPITKSLSLSSYQILFFPSLNLSTPPDLSPWDTPHYRSSPSQLQCLYPSLPIKYSSPPSLRLTPWETPNKRSSLSLVETAGRSTAIPGRLQPFLLPRSPPFSTTQLI